MSLFQNARLRLSVSTQFGKANGLEWYFGAGRPSLDFSFGNDSSALVAEYVSATGSEGPLVITQNANVDIPVIAFGATNGLVPTAAGMNNYLNSIASTDTEVHIMLGYAHVDSTTAADNDAVPFLTDWINRLLQDKLLANF